VTQTTNVAGPNSGADVATIAQQASASVVEIATHTVSSQSLLGGAPGLTDGFVVSSDGLIVTSIHAVHGATALSVATSDGHVFPATIVRADSSHGIVVLRAVNASFVPSETTIEAARLPSSASTNQVPRSLAVDAPFNPALTIGWPQSARGSVDASVMLSPTRMMGLSTLLNV